MRLSLTNGTYGADFQASLRDARRNVGIANRGLKPTATITASLRDERQNADIANRGLKPTATITASLRDGGWRRRGGTGHRVRGLKPTATIVASRRDEMPTNSLSTVDDHDPQVADVGVRGPGMKQGV